MKKDFECQQDFDHKIWGIGDPYQKKREMFVETSYLLLSVNIEYHLKRNIPVKEVRSSTSRKESLSKKTARADPLVCWCGGLRR
jgi:hypothetical protein